MFTAGFFAGSWWLVLFCGVTILILRRSYFILFAGVIIDLLFAAQGDAQFYGGFYTILFFTVTFVSENIRSRLLWSA